MESLTDECGEKAREYVSCAAGGHSRVAGWVDVRFAFWRCDDGWRAFQDDGGSDMGGEFQGACYGVALYFGDAAPGQACKFSDVRGEYQRCFAGADRIEVAGEGVECVGVDDCGATQVSHEAADEFDGFSMGA